MEIDKAFYDKFLESTGVSTDTRTLKRGELFFALSGPNFDGNKFAPQALEAGASYAVVDDPTIATSEQYVLVENTLEALQSLARHHRRTFDIPFIGITGSNGKTTCKELTYHVLRTRYRVHATFGNLNNHIGVPLTLLRMPFDTQIAIIEMGANKVGDIAELCAIAEPSHGFITNIGKAHLEGFGGIEGVIRGKSELYHWLIQHNGIAFINMQDHILSNMAKRFASDKVFGYAGPEDFLTLEFLKADPFVHFRGSEGNIYSSHLAGPFHFSNLAVAITVGKFFDVPIPEAEQAAADYVPVNNRSQLVYRGNTTILLDAYNANPNSMEAALANLKSMPAERKVVILGDMLELGEASQPEHLRLKSLIEAVGPEKVFLVGKQIAPLADAMPQAQLFGHRDELKSYLEANPLGEVTVLIKGSRGIGLEKVLDAFPMD